MLDQTSGIYARCLMIMYVEDMQVTGKTYSLYISSSSSMLLLLLLLVVVLGRLLAPSPMSMLFLVVMLGQMSGTYVGCLFVYDEDMQPGLTGNRHSLYLSSSSSTMLLLAVVLGQTSGAYAYASSLTIKTCSQG